MIEEIDDDGIAIHYPLDKNMRPKKQAKFQMTTNLVDLRKGFQNAIVKMPETRAFEEVDDKNYDDRDLCSIADLGNHAVMPEQQVDPTDFTHQVSPKKTVLSLVPFEKGALEVFIPSHGYKKVEPDAKSSWYNAYIDDDKILKPVGDKRHIGYHLNVSADRAEANMQMEYRETIVVVSEVKYKVSVPYLKNYKVIKKGTEIVVHDPSHKKKE